MDHPMGLDARSLERVIPDDIQGGDVTGAETLKLHLERYEFAAAQMKPGRVLDVACGVGYGTKLLVSRGPAGTTAVGVDLAEEAIAYARRRYADDRIRFTVADAMRFSDPQGFDTIVSLETIEHLPDPGRLVAHLVSLLRPGGVLIGSVPTTPSVDANPHHLHDFSERSFRRLFLRCGLVEICCLRQVQPFKLIPLLTRQESRARDIRRNVPLFYLTHPGSLFGRVWATLRHGFSNHYITMAWRAPT
jgi:SAM-dependent methyltransferase